METRYITVAKLGSGFAAVCLWLNTTDHPTPFWEPFDTGFGRYNNWDKADAEAAAWSYAEGIPYYASKDFEARHRKRIEGPIATHKERVKRISG